MCTLAQAVFLVLFYSQNLGKRSAGGRPLGGSSDDGSSTA